MKKLFILSIMACGFALAANAQTAADTKDEAATTTGTEVKASDEKPGTVKPKDDGTQVSASTGTTVKKQCAGESKSCAKSGEGKSCCKAKTGTSATTGASATQGDKTTEASATKAKGSCTGEHKECCKKKAETKSGS